MSFTDPFAAYNAANNLEAHFVCNLLNEANIEAMVVEDVSQVGVWLGGLISEIHKPQVWIERVNADQARAVLDEYERRSIEREQSQSTGGSIQVTCEECGQTSSFPGTQSGSVQNCPHCNAFLDVGDDDVGDEWTEVSDSEVVDPEIAGDEPSQI